MGGAPKNVSSVDNKGAVTCLPGYISNESLNLSSESTFVFTQAAIPRIHVAFYTHSHK